MREKTCCFTGHRVIPAWEIDRVSIYLREEIQRLILKGYRYFGAGGALGFDTLAAQTVLNLKADFSHIKLILVLPCKDQADRWRATDRAIYEDIKHQADKVVYMTERYTRDCMFQRNRHLVDGSSVCICYLARDSGGTAYTVDYAKKQGLLIYNVLNQSFIER